MPEDFRITKAKVQLEMAQTLCAELTVLAARIVQTYSKNLEVIEAAIGEDKR